MKPEDDFFWGGDIYAQIMSVREADVSVRHTDRIYCIYIYIYIYIYNYFSFSFFVNIKYSSFKQKSQFSFGLYGIVPRMIVPKLFMDRISKNLQENYI